MSENSNEESIVVNLTNSKIHDVLKNKGDYLFFDNNILYLMENNSAKPVKFLLLKPEGDWEGIELGDEYYILAFDLKEKDITEEVGDKILGFLTKLKEQNIKFRISRALPRSIFGNKHISTFHEFNIPKSCRDCLELYKLSSKGNTILCNGNVIRRFRFTKDGRNQVYNYLKLLFGEKTIIKTYIERFDFKLLDNLNCYSQHREISNNFIDFDFEAYWISKSGWEPYEGLYAKLVEYKSILSKGMILDNGGAHGRNSFFIKELGFKVILTDITYTFFKYTKERQKQKSVTFPVIAADSRKLPFKDESFAGVFSGGVMHHNMHLDDVKQYLIESYRVLMSGGIFFGHVWAYWEFGAPPEPHLLQIKDKDKFESILKEAGFVIIEDISEMTVTHEPHKHMWTFFCMKPQKQKGLNKIILTQW